MSVVIGVAEVERSELPVISAWGLTAIRPQPSRRHKRDKTPTTQQSHQQEISHENNLLPASSDRGLHCRFHLDRIEGLQLLAKHRVEKGIKACVTYTRRQNRWASEKRTPELMKILLSYGARAKSVIPELEQIAASFEDGEENFPHRLSLDKAEVVRDTIRAIEGSEEYPELIHIE